MAGEGCDACEDRAARPCSGASTTGQGGVMIGRREVSCTPDIVSARPIDVRRKTTEGRRVKMHKEAERGRKRQGPRRLQCSVVA